MSAQSPRGSISGEQNLADDFRESLQDLTQNNRLEISNLTLIAKESTEYAQEISKVLEEHIKTTAPNRKLPALYVLDSIVKNVGTPYTVYLGRNLYTTFMGAYTQMDSNTRRSMDAMLKTWKEPVAGSMDPRPVFPTDIVRPIEEALLKAKTAMMQSQRHLPAGAYRQTPTPPQYGVPPQLQGQQQFYSQQPGHPQYPQQLPPYQSQMQNPAYRQSTTVQQPGIDVEGLKVEIASLISRMQAQFASNPRDQSLQTKLQALLQLQDVLRLQSLGPTELQQIKSQISQLSAAVVPAPTPPPVQPTPQWQPPISGASPFPFMPQGTPQSAQQSNAPPPALAPGMLESLQALLANGPKPSTPQIRNAAPALQGASHAQLSNVASAPPPMNSNDLLAALTKNNLLPGFQPPTPIPSAPPPASVPPPTAQSTASLLESLKGLLPPLPPSAAPVFGTSHLGGKRSKIPMTAASLKGFRPELITSLYDEQPNQCSNCARRFLATPEGRTKKDRHLDWHFRTNQRMADPHTSRGQHRNWFVDEVEWIQLKEFDPSTTTAEDAAANAAGARPQKRTQDSFVRAPPGMTRNTCSICYEEMKSSYSEELQDWVFMNAVMYGNPPRIVHATCAEEIRMSTMQSSQPVANNSGARGALAAALAAGGTNGGRRSRSATPDSALGKRKAESILAGLSARLKTDQG